MPAIQSIVARDSIFLNGLRSQDPRVGSKQRKAIMESLQTHGGVWDEADLSPLSRHGKSGQIAADSLYDARSRLLAEFNFIGRPGRLAKNYARSVKSSGNVNETTLYRTVLGPFGLASNIMNSVCLECCSVLLAMEVQSCVVSKVCSFRRLVLEKFQTCSMQGYKIITKWSQFSQRS